MVPPLPKELRDRFVRLVGTGLAGREAARRLQLSAATGGRWARQTRRTCAVKVAPMGRPAGTGKLAAHVDVLRERVTQDRDITLFEFPAALADSEGVTVHHSATVGRLKRLGFMHKKVAPSRQICSANRLPVNGMATERRRAKVRRQRDDWTRHRSPTITLCRTTLFS